MVLRYTPLMSIHAFGDRVPVFAPDVYVHPDATIIGDVVLEDGARPDVGAVLQDDVADDGGVGVDVHIGGKNGYPVTESMDGHERSISEDHMKFVHVATRTKNLDAALAFYEALGLKMSRTSELTKGKATLAFIEPPAAVSCGSSASMSRTSKAKWPKRSPA